MAKLKLPFELEKPSANEYVTQASEIGYGGIPAACGIIYDISVAKSVNNVPTKYASLSAALGTNGANIPQDIRKGGMSIKFMQSSDNKYVQYRYMETDTTTVATFTNVANWQGVDTLPTPGSRNLSESGGVAVHGNALDISELNATENPHTSKVYSNLSEALADIQMKFFAGGMSIKFLQTVSPTYSVLKTENVLEVPSVGTEIQEGLSFQSGIYTVSQLTGVTLPFCVGDTLIYYVKNDLGSDEYSYTVWCITKIHESGSQYKYYKYLNSGTTGFLNEENWQGITSVLEDGSSDCATSEVCYINKREIFGENEVFTVPVDVQLTADKWFNMSMEPMTVSPGSLVGTYCVRIPVQQGERYRIFGIGNSSSALRLWKTTNSSLNEVRVVSGAVNSRVTPVELTINNGEAYLYVNLNNYSALTDRVQKLSQVTVEHKGILDELTIVEDNLSSTSTQKALSANQGRILNEGLNGVTNEVLTECDYFEDRFCNTSSTMPHINNGELEGCNLCEIPVQEGDVFKIYGNGPNNAINLYSFANSNREFVYRSGIMNTRRHGIIVTIPSGVAYLSVNLYDYDENTDHVYKVTYVTTGGFMQEHVIPYVNDTVENLKPFNGKKIVCFGDSITEYTDIDGKSYTDYLAELSGANVINVGSGGAMIRSRVNPSLLVDSQTDEVEKLKVAYSKFDIYNLITAATSDAATRFDELEDARDYLITKGDDNSAMVARFEAIDWSKIDAITIFAGTNDFNNAHSMGTTGTTNWYTMLGAINYIISTFGAKYKNIPIFWFTPIVRWVSPYADADWCDVREVQEQGTMKKLSDYATAIIDECKKVHIPVCDMYYGLGWNKFNFWEYFNNVSDGDSSTDGTHPYKGFKFIARKIYGFLASNKTF